MASLDQRAGNQGKQAAFVALFLALVLVFVGGTRTATQRGNLVVATDHGLVGATAELAQAGSLPTGKLFGEASPELFESQSERETEDDSDLALLTSAHLPIQTQWFADRAVHAVDTSSAMRVWLLLASIGARGPPVG
jgi:hypothetical protein